jgi:hypothetical protein
LARLEKEDRLHPARVFEALERKALSNEPDAVAAARLLLSYVFGAPRQMIDVTHEAGESWQALLVRVTQGDTYRREMERLEEWRRQRTLTSAVEQVAD